MKAQQLALDLRHRTAMGREDFLISPCNADAVAWIDLWPDWSGPALALTGPAGSGKSHLAQVWRHRSGARVVEASALQEFHDVADGACVAVEDVDRLQNDAAVLHLYNAVVERNGSLLVTAREPPARWRRRRPDLVSRLAAAPTVHIGKPDEALMAAVMVKMLGDLRLDVSEQVLNYMAIRVERSFEAARQLISEIHRTSLATRRRVTVPLVREILEGRTGGAADRPRPGSGQGPTRV